MLWSNHSTSLRSLVLPSWLLVPGVAVFGVSLSAFLMLKRVIGIEPYDLSVYLTGGRAFMEGLPAYQEEIRSPIGIGHFGYPPVTLLIFGPLSRLGVTSAHGVMTTCSIVALLATIWLAMRMAGVRKSAGLVGGALGLAGVALWLQPVHGTLDQGQVNIVLMGMVMVDLALDGRRWPTGILIGIAVAVKITPGIFILYLLVTRRYRAAMTAAATWAILTAVGFLVAGRDSVDYWLGGIFANARRTISPVSVGDVANQSLNGIITRYAGENGRTLWMLLVVAFGALGFIVALAAHRRGESLAGVLAIAVTGLLISPVSWNEHWVWMVPVLVCLGAVSTQFVRTSPIMAGAIPVVPVVPFLAWPLGTGDWRVTRQISPESILGPAGHMLAQGNNGLIIAMVCMTYVLIGIALLILGAWALWRASSIGVPDGATSDDKVATSSPRGVDAGRVTRAVS